MKLLLRLFDFLMIAAIISFVYLAIFRDTIPTPLSREMVRAIYLIGVLVALAIIVGPFRIVRYKFMRNIFINSPRDSRGWANVALPALLTMIFFVGSAIVIRIIIVLIN